MQEVRYNPHQKTLRSVLAPNLDKLNMILSNSDFEENRCSQVLEEFRSIRTKLVDQGKRSETQLSFYKKHAPKMKKKISRGTRTATPVTTTRTNPIRRESGEKVIHKEVAGMMTTRITFNRSLGEEFSFIIYKNNDSMLGIFNSSGFCVEKDGERIYSVKNKDLGNLVDALYVDSAYFIYDARNIKIWRKTEDSCREYCFWKGSKKQITEPQKVMRELVNSKGNPALVVNVQNGMLAILEITKKGTLGKQAFLNSTGREGIICHETLPAGKILTLDRVGGIKIIQFKHREYSKSDLIAHTKIKLLDRQYPLDLSLCENKKYWAVLVSQEGISKKRVFNGYINIYCLKTNGRKSSIFLMKKIKEGPKYMSKHQMIFLAQPVDNRLVLFADDESNAVIHYYCYDTNNENFLGRSRVEFPQGSELYFTKLLVHKDQIYGIAKKEFLFRIQFEGLGKNRRSDAEDQTVKWQLFS